MIFPRHEAETRLVVGREPGVAVERLVNAGEVETIDPVLLERQAEDLRPTADEGLGITGLDGDRQRLGDRRVPRELRERGRHAA